MRAVYLPWFGLMLAAWAGTAFGQAEINFRLRTAVFSSDQAFWPQLAKARPADSSPEDFRPAPSKKENRKEKGSKGGQGSKAGSKSAKPVGDLPLHLVVLPLRIKESAWKESIPCDSCHRLSANGMEFFLENYLTDKLRQRFPGRMVELAAPHLPLVESSKLNLMGYLDSLSLPWDKWFDGNSQELIYRPRDWMTSQASRKRMDRIGGILGATHLLLPAKVKVSLEPKASNVHTGNMEWGFHLVFWNVAEGRPEWAMDFTESARNADLDQALDGRLDKALVTAWDRMPEALAALWKAEPQ